MAIEILKTPNIICNEGIKFQTDDIIIQELIDNYVQVIENSQSEENLKLFRRNISKLRIEYKYILFGLIANILKKRTAAQYYLEDNKISMYPLNKKYFGYNISYNTEDFIQDLYHELLHMSSTIIYRDNTIVYSGFSQVGGNIPIGVALDDGYTELLLYRLFNLNKEYMSYKYEVLISSLIEGIISIEKMNNLYFNANLYGLVEELQKYNTRENVIKFLEDLDSIYVIEGRKNYKKEKKTFF